MNEKVITVTAVATGAVFALVIIAGILLSALSITAIIMMALL